MYGLSRILVFVYAPPNTYSFFTNIMRYETKKVSPSLKRWGECYSIRFRRPVVSAQGGMPDQSLMGLLPNMDKYGLCVGQSSRHTDSKHLISVYRAHWILDAWFLRCTADSRAPQLSRYSFRIINVLHLVPSLTSPHPSPRQLSHDIRSCSCEHLRDHPTSVLCRTARTHRKTSQTRCVGVFILFSLADNFQPR